MRFAPNALFVTLNVTNWMTAAGLALIAGGLATLISFRSVLFGGEGRERRSRPRAIEAPRQRAALPAGVVDNPPEEARGGRRGRRRALVTDSGGRGMPVRPRRSDEDERGGLASIGLADDEDELAGDIYACAEADEEKALDEADEDQTEDDEYAEDEEDEEIDPEPQRADRYADRVEGWVRPEHRDPTSEPRPGEYWTPIPVDLAGDHEPSAKGYGWPLPVERLPAVPDYEPATGFDLIPISEPTEVVPTWPVNDDRPGRIRLPRSWSTRNEKTPPTGRRRPRPHPHPPTDHSTVYVSRHAADPPQRPD